jgi:hypothetical protein
MEGNACYKFSTIRNFVNVSRAKDIKVIVDIGANVGDVTLLMHDYFPSARITFEAVKEYCDVAAARTNEIPFITVHNKAVTAQHRFLDDLGTKRRRKRASLAVLKGLPAAGWGWAGGSMVLAEDDERVTGLASILRYDKTGMLVPRPWLSDTPNEWHLFDERHVLPEDRYWHALP